jgi:hypothetical protein
MAGIPRSVASDGGSSQTPRDKMYSFGRASPPSWGVGEAPRAVEENGFRCRSPRVGPYSSKDRLGQASPEWKLPQSDENRKDTISSDDSIFDDDDDDAIVPDENVPDENPPSDVEVPNSTASTREHVELFSVPAPDITPSLVTGFSLFAPPTNRVAADGVMSVLTDAALPLIFPSPSGASQEDPGTIHTFFEEDYMSALSQPSYFQAESSAFRSNEMSHPSNLWVLGDGRMANSERASCLPAFLFPYESRSDSILSSPLGTAVLRASLTDHLSNDTNDGQGATMASHLSGVYSDPHVSASFGVSPPRPDRSTSNMSTSKQGSDTERGTSTEVAANVHYELRHGEQTIPVQHAVPEDPLILQSADILFFDTSTASSITTPSAMPDADPHIFKNSSQGHHPKQLLHHLYGKLPSKTQLSKSDYFTWEDNKRQEHNKRFTCIFICPLSHAMFPSGWFGETTERGFDGTLWHAKKIQAEHAAAARACDFLYSRNKRPLPYGHDDPPYRPSTVPSVLLFHIPPFIQEKMEARARN